ncbi:RNA polymerase sigma-70 factor [Maribellus comscasis]|uniref:RNA polymerase sigma-70 factor n=1 Tax=Maribellus comscasis TaxID=2681766 RepID=A0A6I6JT56_9BACT|nr:RNA polymerase sigma-70 factor [Maribellus comscasis]QGY46216.1 RNA polymerase sigma-70 factor [Maribellus comscasis]
MEKNYEELFIFNRMAQGDKDAFRFFFEKYYAELCTMINFYIQNPEISEEIAQDIYVHFWEKRKNIEISTSVKSYLLKASKNKGLNYLRNERTKLNIHEKLGKVAENNFDEISEDSIDAGWLQDVITRSIDSLPPKCREIFIMAKEKELSYKEIAEQLGISVKTVENQMGKALKNLREILRPYYNEIFVFFFVLLFNLSKV